MRTAGIRLSDGVSRSAGKSGVTFIELLIAVLVVGLVFAGAYPLVTQGMRLNRKARNHFVAVSLAQNRLERAGSFNFADLRLLTETNMVVNEQGVPSGIGKFRRTTTVTTNVMQNLAQLEVRVDIRDEKTSGFDGETETLTMYFTDY